MTEFIPSVLLHGQAMTLLNELAEAQKEGLTKGTDDVVSGLAEILTRFQQNAGRPLLQYEPVVETEPPSQEKANRFWSSVEKDINLMQQQADMLQAGVLFTHNLISTEVEKSKKLNARVDNKVKTLQLYSDGLDSNTMVFGDYFHSLDFVDLDLVPPEERAFFFAHGQITLGRQGQLSDLSKNSNVSIMSSSNGFLGNNHEIEDPDSAAFHEETETRLYVFKAELSDYNLLEEIIDGEPDTWIEYEHYGLTELQQAEAKNYNFTYQRTHEDGTTTRVNWANGPSRGILRLDLRFDLKRIQNINIIEYTPHNLESNVNHPVLIRQVQISTDGTEWSSIAPHNVWIGTDVNLQSARIADTLVTGKASWVFPSQSARYVRFFIEQEHPYRTDVGHVYYVDKETGTTREEGPIPVEENPTEFYGRSVIGNLLQRREYFRGDRWAIAIRDVAIQQAQHLQKSSIITTPLRVGGQVDRVMLSEAEVVVPDNYPKDESWVKFFVSPDDGITWLPISRIQDDYLGIPEQIAFNDPLPEAFREVGVYYYNAEDPVTMLRLKVELSRPDGMPSTTPVLKSYSLKVRLRS